MKTYLGIALFFASYGSIMGQVDTLLLKNYDPVSLYALKDNIPKKASAPIIDMHSHPYPTSDAEIKEWVATMDSTGVQKTILLTYQTGKAFDSIYDLYSKYNDRFALWCGFDYTGYDQEGWSAKAVRELERCYKKGATGVGELGDKGEGLLYSKPTPAPGMHIDDPRMKPLLKKCAELHMPISIHVAEPYWMYQPIDRHNDGLMNAADWQIDSTKLDLLDHAELIKTLENAVSQNPNTIFIACHFANCSYDLSILGRLFDHYKNLYADIAARYAETSPIPRYTKAFYKKYQDRLLYGTDMGTAPEMYRVTFRILETEDEHFYERALFNYHWALYGFGLDKNVLKKLYYENAKKLLDE